MACRLISARFPDLAPNASHVQQLVREGHPLARDYYQQLLKGIRPHEFEQMTDESRGLLSRASGWLAVVR